MSNPLRVGIGGPVGSGKTALLEQLCKAMRGRYDVAAITNDIYTREDAEFLTRADALPPERIAGVETGGCPHTAIREDASMNLAAVADMTARFPGLALRPYGNSPWRLTLSPASRPSINLELRRLAYFRILIIIVTADPGRRSDSGQEASVMAVWKEHDFWKYETFECDIEPETLTGFEDLVRLWRKKQRGRPAPAWSDFDFYDFHGWHGRIAVSELSYDPFDYRYLLFGVEIVKRLQNDYTGKRGSELVELGYEPAEDMAFYDMTCRKMLISRVSGQLYWLGRDHANATFIEFPLSDTGDMATHSLTVML